MSKNKLRFGIGGIPHSKKTDVLGGIARVRELGLEHMELEFVQSVFVTEQKAPEVKQAAEEHDVTLSVHGSYYINLASSDKAKWHASISRIAKAAEIGALCGAKSVTYHSGFFQGKTFPEVGPLVIEGMQKVFAELDKKAAAIKIAPELTGKSAQIGDLPELISLVQALKVAGQGARARFCIDFAHKYARSNGNFNSYDEFMQLIELVRKELGDEYLAELHIHISGIEYSEKGERNHLVFLPTLAAYKQEGIEVEGIEKAWQELPENRLAANKFNWRDLLKALKKSNVGGFVVCESPILELDALLMQSYYNTL
jgi:deoxyribonuclease-4